jgi:hypothetical protein
MGMTTAEGFAKIIDTYILLVKGLNKRFKTKV